MTTIDTKPTPTTATTTARAVTWVSTPMAAITHDAWMGSRALPYFNLPEAQIEQVRRILDCSSWTALAESARDDGWRVVSLPDLCRIAYRAATREQRIAVARTVLRGRIEAQQERWPCVDARTDGVRGDVLRWCDGDDGVGLMAICESEWATRVVVEARVDAWGNVTTDTAAYRAYRAALRAAMAGDPLLAADDPRDAGEGLAQICAILDAQ